MSNTYFERMSPMGRISSKKLKRFFACFVFVAGFAALCVVSALLLLLSHRPGLYRPATSAEPGRVSPYLTETLAPDFFNNIQLGRPFVLTVEQAGLNDILSGLPLFEFDGAAVGDPAVVFTESAVFLMATIRKDGFSAVLTAVFAPAIDRTDRLYLNLESVRLGALPVTAMVRRFVRHWGRSLTALYPDGELWLAAAVANEPVEPVFTIDKYTVRLTAIEPGRGRLSLTLGPARE